MRVLLHAWHGATTGDSILIEYTTHWLQQRFKAEVHWTHPKLSPSLAREFDVLILGPCGVVYDPGPRRQEDLYPDYTDYMVSWIQQASMAHKPVYAFNIGLQDLKRHEKAQLWREALDLCSGITTREPHSTAILEGLGVKAPIVTCRDLTYALPVFSNRPGLAKPNPVLGVNLKAFTHAWSMALSTLRYSCRPRFLGFSVYEPPIGKKMGLATPAWPAYTLLNIGHAFSELDFMVSSHLHSGLFAVMAGVPFLQLLDPEGPNQQKISWSLEDLRWPWTWTLQDPYTVLIKKAQDLIHSALRCKAHMAEARNKLRPQALKSLEILEKWLLS
jgi:hypothetical protein